MAAVPSCCCYPIQLVPFISSWRSVFVSVHSWGKYFTYQLLSGRRISCSPCSETVFFVQPISISVTNSLDESGMQRFCSGYCQDVVRANYSLRYQGSRELPSTSGQDLTSQGLSHHPSEKQGSPSPGALSQLMMTLHGSLSIIDDVGFPPVSKCKSFDRSC